MRIMAAVFAVLLFFVVPAAAQDDSASPQAGAAAKPAGRSAKARKPPPPTAAHDASLPLAERMAIQFDLAWTGDYNGLVTGELNDRITAAIKAFQRDRKLKETGVLDAQQRAILADAATAKPAHVG